MPTNRALARILKLPVIFETVPVKNFDAAGETQIECAVPRKPSRVGSRGPPGEGNAPAGVQGQSPRKLCGLQRHRL